MGAPANSDKIEIRPAETKDSDEIAGVMVAARDATLPNLSKIDTKEEFRVLMKLVLVPKNDVWVAEMSGKGIVGFMVVSESFLNYLSIHPSHWSKGIGSKLLDKAKDRNNTLTVTPFQKEKRTRSFYELHGFKQLELCDGFGNQEHEPDALYEWIKSP